MQFKFCSPSLLSDQGEGLLWVSELLCSHFLVWKELKFRSQADPRARGCCWNLGAGQLGTTIPQPLRGLRAHPAGEDVAVHFAGVGVVTETQFISHRDHPEVGEFPDGS